MKEPQPPEANHQIARRVKAGIRRYRAPVRLGRLSSGAEGVLISARGCSKSGTVACCPVATEVFGFWLFIHASWKLEQRDGSADEMALKPHCAARLWRLPPKSANTLHKHLRAEEFYFVVEGVGRIRVGDDTLTVPKHGGVLVGPSQLRQVFNDTESDVLWLIIGAPEEVEFLPGANTKPDKSLIYPVDPKQLPGELAGGEWPPKA